MKRITELLEEMVKQQELQIQKLAHRHRTHLTSDDLLQPNDFPQLESDPEFRFEEGIRAGLLSALAAIRAEEARKE